MATEVAAVREASGRLADDWRAVKVVWRRELIRFSRNRTRIVTSLAQPLLFLFVLGSGLSPVLPGGNGSVNYRTFMFPGVLAMTVLFTSMFSAVSIVWDREFGFLREMLVAPVRRSALIIGKCLGGSTVATLQGTILLALAGAVGVPYSPTLLISLVLMMALAAIMLTAIGTMVASRLATIESFQVLMQLIALPMFFLSGAVFPLNRLPGWLATLTRFDPLTYAVDPMRRAVFDHLSVPAATKNGLVPGLTWGSWRVPTVVELGIVAVVAAFCLWIAVLQFSRAD
jgi:ABC-2 type transport system permease protein